MMRTQCLNLNNFILIKVVLMSVRGKRSNKTFRARVQPATYGLVLMGSLLPPHPKRKSLEYKVLHKAMDKKRN